MKEKKNVKNKNKVAIKVDLHVKNNDFNLG